MASQPHLPSLSHVDMASLSIQPPAINPAPQELTNNDLALLLNTLNPVTSKCFALGLQLGVTYPQLRKIEYEYRRCDDQLREIISERLRQESPLTWHDIARALRAGSVSENRLASEIENKYVRHLPPPASVAPQANTVSLTTSSLTSSLQSSLLASQCDTSPLASSSVNQYYQSDQMEVNAPQPPSSVPHQERAGSSTYTSAHHSTPSSSHSNTTYHAISVPTTNRHSQQEESVGTGRSNQLLISHSEPQLTHTQTHRPSGSSSVESGCPPAKRLHLGTILDPNNQLHTQGGSGGSGSTGKKSKTLKDGGTKVKSRQLKLTSFGCLSVKSLNDRDPPQSVRQAPGREHSQSEEGPQRPHLQAAVTSSPILHSTSSQYSSPVNTGITPVVQQFIDYVKTIYRECVVERDTKVVKWPPTPSTVYINLACINRKSVSGKSREYTEITEAMVRDGNVDVINTTKGPIEFGEIAKGIAMPSGKHTGEEKRVILVEGAPGVGKSTFAREFCRRWERGEIAQQYQLVLLLRLRDDRISKAKSLKDLIYHPLESVAQAVYEELGLSCNFHALIILEGFDELPYQCQKNESIFFQLIAGKLLPLATVLVTSRPWATEGIRGNYGNRIYQHIEILGFTSQQITEYIERTLPQDKVSDLKAYLEKHPQIRMGMYIPLNSAIVVTVYQESQESGCALPTTLTELYTAMAQTLLVRYLRGHPQYETAAMKTFSDLPPAVYTKFIELCKLAYEGIAGTIASGDIQLIFPDLPSDFDSLGLMDSVTELYAAQGAVSSHNFLHLTFQEYFAAVHISTLSPAEQLEHFQRHRKSRLKVVLRFLAGLTKLKTVTHEQLRGLLGEPHNEPSDECQPQYCKSMKADVCVSAHHTNWLFEAQNADLVQSLLHNHTAAFTFTSNMLQLEYYSVGYCIAHSHSKWLLTFKEDTSVEKLNMIANGVETGNVHRSRVAVKITKLLSNKKLSLLWKGFSSCIEELYLTVPKSLSLPNLSALRRLELTLDKMSHISDLSIHCLESLTIIGTAKTGVSSESSKAISKLLSSSSSLKEFCVIGKFRDKPLEVMFNGMSKKALPLNRLEINGSRQDPCLFSTTASRSLGQFITMSTLQHLRICNVKISCLRLIVLITAIHNCSSLQEKRIERLTLEFDDEWSDVSTEEVRTSLTPLINTHPDMVDIEESLRSLSATEENYIKASLIAFCCDCYFKINLDNRSISDAGAVALAQALHHNSTLEWLDLSNNSISDAGAVALAQALHHNSTLEELNLSGNGGIDKEGTHQLVQALTVNTSVGGRGLKLSKRCEKYATQCTQYHEVKERIDYKR